jgi:hypothetical protein
VEKAQLNGREGTVVRGPGHGHDVPGHHVGFAHRLHRLCGRGGDRLLDQTFLQPDPEVARDDFHHVLRLEGRKGG